MAKVIAHRGASAYAPENTAPAFELAIQMGANGVEMDVHHTNDGELVVHHNYYVDDTSDGKGLIQDLTLEELKGMDFGAKFKGENPERFAGTKILTLSEFLELAKGMETINIEIKSPRIRPTSIVYDVIEKLDEFGLTDQAILSSFDHPLMLEAKAICPQIKTGLLYDFSPAVVSRITEDPVGYAKTYRADAIHPFFMFVNEDMMEQCSAAGIAVNPWTVDSEEAVRTLSGWGCDCLITNKPDLVCKTLKE